MRNWTRLPGVYNTMQRISLVTVFSLVAAAQPLMQQDPLDTAIQAVWQSRTQGNFEGAGAAREQARALLQRVPVDSPRFAGWVQQVAQIYQASGWNAKARAILEESLTRAAPLGDSHPSRLAILNALGESWRQDGNLLKAVGFLEQAAASQATAPPPATAQIVHRAVMFSGKFFSYDGSPSPDPNGGALYAYTRLAELYRQLGRPDAVAAIAVKI